MIGLEDRQTMVCYIEIARAAGARRRQACEVAAIMRTLERRKADGGPVGTAAPGSSSARAEDRGTRTHSGHRQRAALCRDPAGRASCPCLPTRVCI